MAPRHLRLHLLGGLEVEGLSQHEVGSRKARSLLKMLALARGQAVPADRIADGLWGEDQPSRPAEQVGVLVSRLRAVLGAERIVRSDAGYALRADWLDVEELEARVEEAAARLASGAFAAARGAAKAALDLARGPLLADEDGEWLIVERASAERSVARARLLAAEAALGAGDATVAASNAEAALDHDPYDEAALRLAMSAFSRAGRPGSALACYSRVRKRLAEDLGVSPSPETERVYERVLAEEALVASAPATRRPERPPPPTLVSRDTELRLLHDALARVAGGSEAVVIEGEAGIGKTALVERFAHEAAGLGAVVLSGRCDERGRDLPLQPLLDAIDAHLLALDTDVTSALLAPDEAVLSPLLGRSFATPERAPAATALPDADTGRALLFGALLGLLRRLAAGTPVVVVVEDAHHAGASTLEWCQITTRRTRNVLFVLTARPGPSPVLRRSALVRLGPLGPEAVAELVGRERGAELYERSGGHPLFLVELEAAPRERLPESIRAAVQERAEALGPAATSVRAAAVLARQVDLDVLAAATRQPVGEILEHLETAVQGRLLVERGGSFTFAHDLVREALEAGTPAARRAYLHRNAARALSGRAGADPLIVAWHARQGGEPGLAADALVAAARLAERRFDLAAAEQHLDDAVALWDSAELRLARARVRMARNSLVGANDDAVRAVAMGGGAPALELAGWVAYYRRNYDAAARLAEEGLERASDPGLRASCLTLAGRLHHSRGGLTDAQGCLEEAVRIAPPGVRGVAQVWLGGLLTFQGRPEAAVELCERALLEPDRLVHPFALLHGLFSRTRALGMQGRCQEAFAALAELDATVSRQHHVRFGAVAENIRAWLLRNVGRVEEADEANRRAVATSLDPSQREPHYVATLDLTESCLLGGDLDGAVEWLARAESADGEDVTMAWHQRHRLGLLGARLAAAAGDLESAESVAASVLRDATERGDPRYRSFATAVLGCVRALRGEAVDHSALDDALGWLDRVAGLEAWRYSAELAALTGVGRWWTEAESRLGRLVHSAGNDGPTLQAWASGYLERLRRRPGAG